MIRQIQCGDTNGDLLLLVTLLTFALLVRVHVFLQWAGEAMASSAGRPWFSAVQRGPTGNIGGSSGDLHIRHEVLVC